MGGDFPPPCMASAHGTSMACRGKHPAHTHGAHSMSTVATVEVLPSGAQRHGEHVPQSANCSQFGCQCSTRRAGASWHAVTREEERPCATSSACNVAPTEQAHVWRAERVFGEDPAHQCS